MSVEVPVQLLRPREPKPEWLKVRAPGSERYLRLEITCRMATAAESKGSADRAHDHLKRWRKKHAKG